MRNVIVLCIFVLMAIGGVNANDNGDLDTNFIGIPKEPVALSNDARMKFGPPKYKDAVFSLTSEGLAQRIEMKAI